MERTGLGRTPIREALRTLANEQLVEIFPRRGVLVAGVNAGDLAGLSEVRRLLEPPAARPPPSGAPPPTAPRPNS